MKIIRTIRKIIPVALFLLYFLSLQSVLGQNQINIAEYLSQKFKHYCESVPREEIYITTDRQEYIAGEDLWFNIFLIDRQSFLPSTISKIVYFELLNPENRPVVQKRILIDNGSGPGQIELPDSLSTGTYTIRAYTSWMKNFSPYNFFINDIKVYNSYKSKSFKGKVYRDEISVGERGNKTDSLITNPRIALKVKNNRPDTLEIFVNADERYRSGNENLFYLVIQTRGSINLVSSGKFTEENMKIAVPRTLLSSGINQITIFDFKGQPVCERYIYTQAGKEKQYLTLHSADSSETRSKISVGLEIDDSLSNARGVTNLSISVVPETNATGKMDLNNFMIFGTEYGSLPGRIINGRKFNDLSSELIDSLLLNVTSNWINWRNILSVDPPEFTYQAEKEDHYLYGLLLTSDQQLAHPGEFLLISTPGKVPVFQFTRTNYEAKFNFGIHIDEALQDLIIQPDDISKNNKIYFESSFSDQNIPTETLVDSSGKSVPSYISKWRVNYQVKEIYGSSAAGNNLIRSYPKLKSKRFYGKPDAEVLLKNYIKLPVMEEVFFEIVPRVTLKKTDSEYGMSIIDAFGNKLYNGPPVMLIDGVPIKDASVVANLDPELVETIDVVRERYIVGDYSFNGIVNVITKSGDFTSITVPDYAIRLPYRVIDPVPQFVSPDYSSAEVKDSRTPDFRNTLYWNPSVKPDKEGRAKIEFWTSDIKSGYEINIQGITPEGKVISVRKHLSVK